MKGWREVESILAETLRREGFTISHVADTFAETRGRCQMAQIGEARCNSIGPQAINITRLAKEIAE